MKIENLIIYFNDYFIRNKKHGESENFEIKDYKSGKSILRAFARTRAKNIELLQKYCQIVALEYKETNEKTKKKNI